MIPHKHVGPSLASVHFTPYLQGILLPLHSLVIWLPAESCDPFFVPQHGPSNLLPIVWIPQNNVAIFTAWSHVLAIWWPCKAQNPMFVTWKCYKITVMSFYLLLNPTWRFIHCHFHKSPPLVPVLSQMNPVHIFLHTRWFLLLLPFVTILDKKVYFIKMCSDQGYDSDCTVTMKCIWIQLWGVQF